MRLEALRYSASNTGRQREIRAVAKAYPIRRHVAISHNLPKRENERNAAVAPDMQAYHVFISHDARSHDARYSLAL